MRYLLVILFLFGLSNHLQAQFPKGIGLEPQLHYGKIIKHSDEIFFDVNQASYAVGLNLKIQTRGQKPWHELQHYPQFGIQLLYFHLGEKELLGDAYAFLPGISIPILRKVKKLKSYFEISTGFAYLTQHFDRLNNTTNNAIGSHWNNAIQIQFGTRYSINSQWTLKGAGVLSHFSNGGAKLPNLGINIPTIMIGINYTPKPFIQTDYIFHETKKEVIKKWKLDVHFDLAFRENRLPGGPLYTIYIGSFGALYHFSKINRSLAGVEYEFNESAYQFGWDTFTFHNEKEARLGASRLSLYAGHEFLFGNWGIQLKAGAYLGSFSYLIPYPVYFKISTRYYLPSFGQPKTRFYTAIYLKSHLFRAEYMALGVGAVF